MSYSLERKGEEYFTESEFKAKVCGRCKHKKCCAEWELAIGGQFFLGANHVNEMLLPADSGKLGVYRCTVFEEVSIKS